MVIAAVGSALLLVELGAVILACGLAARFASRLSLSPIPLFLGVGLLLNEAGPIPLGASRDFVEAGAAIGVVLLLFTLGLEYTPAELIAGLRHNRLSGVIDLVANGLPGFLAGLAFGLDLTEAVALAGVTYISSSGIVAKLLGDLGRMANRETPVILSILVIEDLVMALYLPILAGLVAGGSAAAITASAAGAIVMVGAVLALAMRAGPTLSRLVFSDSPEVLLLTVFGLTLLVAGLAESLNVSAAVGAFLVGIALSGPAAERAAPLLSPLRDVFGAAFFVFFALEVDLAAMPNAILPAIALVLVTGSSKIATGWWSARQSGIGSRGRWRTGATLVARGEFSIVIAGLVVAADPQSDLGALAATYVLILASTGPIAARYSDKLILAMEQRRARPNPRPSSP